MNVLVIEMNLPVMSLNMIVQQGWSCFAPSSQTIWISKTNIVVSICLESNKWHKYT